MSLQRRMKQQTVKFRIHFVVFERVKGEAFEDSSIVLEPNGIGNYCERIEARITTCFVIENRGVELLLGCEVSKHHRLGDARGSSNFARGRTAKAAFGKQADCDSEDLHAAFFACHA